MDYNSFLTRDCKLLGKAPRSGKRPPYTRLHAFVVFAALLAILTLLSFISGDAEANRHAQKDAIELDQQPLTQIHFSKQLQPNTANEPIVEVVEKPLDNSIFVKTVTVKSGHTLASIFKKNNISHRDLYLLMKQGKHAKNLRNLHPGQELVIKSHADGKLHGLSYQINRLSKLDVKRVNDAFELNLVNTPLETRITYASGTIQSSLFESGKQAGLSDSLVMEMAGIFGWDIDFALDIRQGDSYSLLFEEQFIDGKKYRDGAILAAEFTSQGKQYTAIRYTDAKGHSNYYTPKGYSMRKAFLRTPVDFRRISSKFGNRRHPTLNRMRLHKGVDYAAPRGTPIRASGDGKIIFRGRKGGYGRVIIVQHGSRYSTLYAHMRSFRKGLRVGSRVKQGQTIGYVGSSGRATGPHLHYEFRVNGAHRNPLTVRLPTAAPIKEKYKSDYKNHATRMISQLNAYQSTRVAINEQ